MYQLKINDQKQIHYFNEMNILTYNIAGSNMIIESESETEGVRQFKFDSRGAFMNNATLTIQKDRCGQLVLDPKYGIAAGTSSLYSINGTTVNPSFMESSYLMLMVFQKIPISFWT